MTGSLVSRFPANRRRPSFCRDSDSCDPDQTRIRGTASGARLEALGGQVCAADDGKCCPGRFSFTCYMSKVASTSQVLCTTCSTSQVDQVGAARLLVLHLHPSMHAAQGAAAALMCSTSYAAVAQPAGRLRYRPVACASEPLAAPAATSVNAYGGGERPNGRGRQRLDLGCLDWHDLCGLAFSSGCSGVESTHSTNTSPLSRVSPQYSCTYLPRIRCAL